MNQELRTRLIGALVVTALAAIFIPMLFDDPVDDDAQEVSQLEIPKEPIVEDEAFAKVPESTEDVVGAPESDTDVEERAFGTDQVVKSTDDLESEAASGEVADFGPAAENLDTGVVEEEPVAEEEPVTEEPAIEKPVVMQPKVVIKPKASEKKPESTKAIAAKKAVEAAKANKDVKPAQKHLGAGRFYLQAGSFSKKENAVALSENLRKQGMPVVVEAIKVMGKGTVYRLKVGPELDKKRAAAMKAKLDGQNIKSILIAE